MFYRTYPQWKVFCQMKYTTENLAEVGAQSSSYANLLEGIYVQSVLITLLYFFGTGIPIMLPAVIPVNAVIILIMSIYYILALKRMNNVDIELI